MNRNQIYKTMDLMTLGKIVTGLSTAVNLVLENNVIAGVSCGLYVGCEIIYDIINPAEAHRKNIEDMIFK